MDNNQDPGSLNEKFAGAIVSAANIALVPKFSQQRRNSPQDEDKLYKERLKNAEQLISSEQLRNTDIIWRENRIKEIDLILKNMQRNNKLK